MEARTPATPATPKPTPAIDRPGLRERILILDRPTAKSHIVHVDDDPCLATSACQSALPVPRRCSLGRSSETAPVTAQQRSMANGETGRQTCAPPHYSDLPGR